MLIQIPTNCPCCDSPLEWVNDQLFCRNSSCSAQLNKKLEHFTKTLGIKGFGPKTVEKLDLADITELFYLDRDVLVEQLASEKLADKLLEEIDRAKTSDLATVLASFSIPLIGSTLSKKICEVVESVDDITHEACRQAGLGEKATNNLLNFIQHDFPEMRPFLPFSFISEPKSKAINAPVVCITGKLKTFKTKAEAVSVLTAAGYKVVESVTKATQFLVDEENKGSTKRTKAEQLGVQIITNLETFLKEDEHNV